MLLTLLLHTMTTTGDTHKVGIKVGSIELVHTAHVLLNQHFYFIINIFMDYIFLDQHNF